jgi:hypothetical protein
VCQGYTGEKFDGFSAYPTRIAPFIGAPATKLCAAQYCCIALHICIAKCAANVQGLRDSAAFRTRRQMVGLFKEIAPQTVRVARFLAAICRRIATKAAYFRGRRGAPREP